MATGDLGIDYAWQHPDPAKIVASGYRFVLRYLSNDPSKDISAAERDAVQAAGLGIGLVWESTAGRMTQGAAAGAEDAKRANAKADALGFPSDRPIFFACDTNVTAAQLPTCLAYLQAAGVGRPVGVYGQFSLVEYALDHGVKWAWQTVAWSDGKVSERAHLYQRGKPTRPAPGSNYDENVAMQDDYGVWFPGGTPPRPKEWDEMATKAEVQAAVVQAIKDEFEWYTGPVVVLTTHSSAYVIPTLGGLVRAMADSDTPFTYSWVYADGTTSPDVAAKASRKPLDLAVPAADPTHGAVYAIRVLHGTGSQPLALAQYTHAVIE